MNFLPEDGNALAFGGAEGSPAHASCLALDPDDFIAPGATHESDTEEEAGDEQYQCCIHPWMRLTAHVREK